MADSMIEGGAGKARVNPALAAALIGGAAAAGAAGAIWSARAIARRNGARRAADLSPVMQTAVTASELAHGEKADAERKGRA